MWGGKTLIVAWDALKKCLGQLRTVVYGIIKDQADRLEAPLLFGPYKIRVFIRKRINIISTS